MAECAGLENQCTLTGTVGSNPTLSAFFVLCTAICTAFVQQHHDQCPTLEGMPLFIDTPILNLARCGTR